MNNILNNMRGDMKWWEYLLTLPLIVLILVFCIVLFVISAPFVALEELLKES